MWVRGLKLALDWVSHCKMRSHPMWVRGLKLSPSLLVRNHLRRILCGCVD